MEFEKIHKKLLQDRDTIYKSQSYYRKKLQELEIKYKENQRKIYENCIKHHGNHTWEAFREDGPYGERYYICKNCNTENY